VNQTAQIIIKLLLISCLLSQKGIAQRRFNASVNSGVSFSQIDGDKLAGFDKAGYQLGITTGIELDNKMDLTAEFLYNHRGASSSIFFDKSKDIQINMNYVDIPLVFSIKDWEIEEKNYYKVFAKTGIQYSRLINSSTNFVKYELPLSMVSNFEFSYLIGFGYNFNNKTGIEFRYSRSLRRTQNILIEDIGNFKIYYWSFRVNYYL